jgi:hypothetical protein
MKICPDQRGTALSTVRPFETSPSSPLAHGHVLPSRRHSSRHAERAALDLRLETLRPTHPELGSSVPRRRRVLLQIVCFIRPPPPIMHHLRPSHDRVSAPCHLQRRAVKDEIRASEGRVVRLGLDGDLQRDLVSRHEPWQGSWSERLGTFPSLQRDFYGTLEPRRTITVIHNRVRVRQRDFNDLTALVVDDLPPPRSRHRADDDLV